MSGNFQLILKECYLILHILETMFQMLDDIVDIITSLRNCFTHLFMITRVISWEKIIREKCLYFQCNVKTVILNCFLKFFSYEGSFWIESLRFTSLVLRAVQTHLHIFPLGVTHRSFEQPFPSICLNFHLLISEWCPKYHTAPCLMKLPVWAQGHQLSVLSHEQNIWKTQRIWTNQ